MSQLCYRFFCKFLSDSTLESLGCDPTPRLLGMTLKAQDLDLLGYRLHLCIYNDSFAGVGLQDMPHFPIYEAQSQQFFGTTTWV